MPDMTDKTIGKYRLTRRLGRGGMAEVYYAHQEALERDVAIKLMHSFLADDPEFVGRFKREAKAVAALRHPHIVQVYDFDIEDDMHYMVMEYISGETLQARLERLNAEGQRMPLNEVARVLTALCDALDYAHAEGRVHRDLKPANIMFDGSRLVLTDFGIATIAGGTRYTSTGAMVGTPAYMAPEQVMGQPGDVQSDVYAVGIILYEVMTGRLPFEGDTPMAVALKQLNEPLPPPRSVCPDIPLAVEQVMTKALAKSPEVRYQSAGALAVALEAAISGAKVPVEMTRPLPEGEERGAETALLAEAQTPPASPQPAAETKELSATDTPATPEQLKELALSVSEEGAKLLTEEGARILGKVSARIAEIRQERERGEPEQDEDTAEVAPPVEEEKPPRHTKPRTRRFKKKRSQDPVTGVVRGIVSIPFIIVRSAISLLIMLIILILVGAYGLSIVIEREVAAYPWNYERLEAGVNTFTREDVQNGLEYLGFLDTFDVDFRAPNKIIVTGLLEDEPKEVMTIQCSLSKYENQSPRFSINHVNKIRPFVIDSIISRGVERGLDEAIINSPLEIITIHVDEDALIIEARPRLE